MSKVLYIKASPRGSRSKSVTVADEFIAEYSKSHTDDQVETLNLFEEDLPSFDGFTIQAKYNVMHGEDHDDEQAAAWKRVEEIIEHFKSADKYVMAIPMWNFSIPYRLKQYIDILVQPSYTFNYSQKEGYTGLVRGKPIMMIYARGGQYSQGSGMESYDLQTRYMDVIAKFIGFEDIRTIVIEPTLQGSPDLIEEKVQLARDKAREMAVDF